MTTSLIIDECLEKIKKWLATMQTERKCSTTASVCRAIRNLTDADRHIVISALRDGIKDLVTAALKDNNINLSVKGTIKACNVLNGCFDNFPFAASAVGSLFDEIASFLVDSLNICCKVLKDDKLPANLTKQETVDLVHTCSRLLTLVMKLKRTPQHTQSLEVSSESVNVYQHWCATCIYIINHVGWCAIDTKINIAMSLWLIKELTTSSDMLLKFHQEFLSSLPHTAALEDSSHHVITFILAAGALNILNPGIILPCDAQHYLRLLLLLCDNYSSDTQLLLMTTRILQVLAKHTSFISWSSSNTKNEEIVTATFTLLEHPVPCVRHAARDLLYTLVLIPFLHVPIQTSLMAAGPQRKSYYIGLAALSSVVDSRTILNDEPSVVKNVIHALHDPTTVSHVSAATESLSLHDSLAKSDILAWTRLWVMPLLHAVQSSPTLVGSDIEKLLLRMFKEIPSAMEIALKQWKEDGSEENYLFGVLSCLKIRNKLHGDGASLFHLIQSDEADHDILRRCIEDGSDDLRLSALSLISESAAPPPPHLSAVALFLTHNLNNHRPATRQKVSSMYKKLLTRVNILWQSAQRVARKKTQHPVSPCKKAKAEDDSVASPPKANGNEKTKRKEPLNLESAEVYEQFVKSLVECCFDNIFAGANFNRLNAVLSVLTICQDVLDPELCAKIGLHDAKHWSKLLTALSSSYEENKIMAVGLSRRLPFHEMEINNPDDLMLEFRRSFGLIQQLEPPSVLLGGYLLQVLLTVPNSHAVLKARFTCGIAEPCQNVDVLCIQILARYLSLQIDEARESLLTAARQSPMYGLMFTIRLLLKTLDAQHLHLPECKQVLNDLIKLSFDMADVVSAVVNNSSPEGHLPMDFHRLVDDNDQYFMRPDGPKAKISDLQTMVKAYKSAGCPEIKLELAGLIRTYLEDELHCKMEWDSLQPLLDPNSGLWSESILETRKLLSEYDSYHKFFQGHLPKFIEDRTVTAQALLLFSWRSMKEACLYLGDLTSKIPLNLAVQSSILSEASIQDIGLKLRRLLSEIKHRGAFEQADVAFGQLCAALWVSPMSSLQTLPFLWLEEILAELMLPAEQQKLKFTSTRRSAGLPFLVQGIVATEVTALNATSSRCLGHTMGSLLKVAEDGTIALEPRLHAYNILRALFKHAQLGELVAHYVSAALNLAIRGSRGDTWPERNCANMLFSTLIMRVFGVSRSKNQISAKNKMTSRVFFQRFPELYQVFHDELTAVGGDKTGVVPQPSLYLVLLIMGRLYPPSRQEPDGVDLTPFVRHMSQCGGHPIWRIRVLAARALVSFLPSNQIVGELAWKLKQLQRRDLTNNYRHGLLLQVMTLLQESIKLPDLAEEINLLGLPLWMLPNTTQKSSVPYPVLDALVQVLTVVHRHYPKHCDNLSVVLTEACDWSASLFSAANREAAADAFWASWTLLKLEVSSGDSWGELLSMRNCGVESIENIVLYYIYCVLTSPDNRDTDCDFSLLEGVVEKLPWLACPDKRTKLKHKLRETVNWKNYIYSERLILQRTKNVQQRRLRTIIIGKIIEEDISTSPENLAALDLITLYEEGWEGVYRQSRKSGSEADLTEPMYRRVFAAMKTLEEGDKQCRVMLATVFAKSYRLLVPSNHISPVALSLRRLWLMLYRLLVDEDEDVRVGSQVAVRIIANQIPGRPMPAVTITPLAAQDFLVSCYQTLISHSVPCGRAEMTLLAVLSLVETIEEPDEDDPLEIFKRGNPNPFCEPVSLIRHLVSKCQEIQPSGVAPVESLDVLTHCHIELSPHFARYGLRLKPVTSLQELLGEFKRLPVPDNAASDVFWTQTRFILGCCHEA